MNGNILTKLVKNDIMLTCDMVLMVNLYKEGGKMTRRKLFKIIFDTESVSEQVLSENGFEQRHGCIVVDKKNIANYKSFKKKHISNMLKELGLENLDEFLPYDLDKQADELMKIIIAGVIQLDSIVTVKNVKHETLNLIKRLGYLVHFGWFDEEEDGAIYLCKYENAKDVIEDTKYLKAETAEGLKELINKYLLISFLAQQKVEGKSYVIIQMKAIPEECDSEDELKKETEKLLRELELEYTTDLYGDLNLRYPTLALINLENFEIDHVADIRN